MIAAAIALAAAAAADTLPYPVFAATPGKPVGWARSGALWFVVYVDRRGGDWCALRDAHWRMALLDPAKAPRAVTDDRLVAGAMCGNDLAWVRAGSFSDGRHREIAFQLRVTPSIGAQTFLYRVDGGRFRRLGVFWGDRVTLGRGTVTARWENRGRSPDGKSLRYVYRWAGDRYRLASRS